MRIPLAEDIKRIALNLVQPLSSALFQSVDDPEGINATMTDAPFFGAGKQAYKHTYLYGLVGSPIKSVVGYYQNLHGKMQAPTIMAHLDRNRPIPSAQGEVILYCLTADGSAVPVKATLGVEGTFTLAATTVKLGSAAAASPLVLGDVLKTLMDGLITQVGNAVSAIETLNNALTTNAATFIAVTGSPGGPSPVNPAIASAISTATSSLGTVATQLASLQNEYVDTAASNFLSETAFTER